MDRRVTPPKWVTSPTCKRAFYGWNISPINMKTMDFSRGANVKAWTLSWALFMVIVEKYVMLSLLSTRRLAQKTEQTFLLNSFAKIAWLVAKDWHELFCNIQNIPDRAATDEASQA